MYLVVPHLTVGTLAYGGGTILEPRDCRCLRWRIACPPVFLEEFGGSPTWSRDELFVADVTALARALSGSEWFLSRTLRPVPLAFISTSSGSVSASSAAMRWSSTGWCRLVCVGIPMFLVLRSGLLGGVCFLSDYLDY